MCKSELVWSTQEQREAEFRVANIYLRSHDGPAVAGTVLKNSDKNLIDPKTDTNILLNHRYFIDEKGTVYAEAQKPFSEGICGKLTMAETEDSRRWVVKEQVVTQESFPFLENELKIASDLNMGQGFLHTNIGSSNGFITSRVNTRTHTHKLIYEGVPLVVYLSENKSTLFEDQRLDLAIKATRAVYEFRGGTHSKTLTQYAHLDIRAENFIIDDKGNIHLKFFGFSQPIANDSVKLNKDVSALMNTLFLHTDENCILNDTILNRGCLRSIFENIKLEDEMAKNCYPSMLELYVALILRRFELDDFFIKMNTPQYIDFEQFYKEIETKVKPAFMLAAYKDHYLMAEIKNLLMEHIKMLAVKFPNIVNKASGFLGQEGPTNNSINLSFNLFSSRLAS